MARKSNTSNAGENQSDSVSIWMPLFINEHKAAASTLTHLEHSASVYFAILLWENGGLVPNDDKFLARHLRLKPKEWTSVKELLLLDCVVAGATITHPATVDRVEKARAKRIQNSEAAKARWSKKNDADAMRTHNERNADAMLRASEGECEGNSSYPAEGTIVDGGIVPFRKGEVA